jgi:hypothetical protein
MQTVARSDLIDYETYRERRDAERPRIFAIKNTRRIHLGDALTFLFENPDTVRYQIQEMMLAERIVKEAAIQHELDTYNGLLGGPGALGCSLLIEIDDPVQRREKLAAWLDLPRHVYVRLEDDERIYATFDPGQIGEDRLSAVQYLKFDTRGRVPTAIGCDLPDYVAEVLLSEAQREALKDDLAR